MPSGLVGVDWASLLRNEEDRDGMKAEIMLGRGRRVCAGSEGCSLIVGKVVSPYVDGLLNVS